ncbi:glycosyltransferase family 2 protein [Alkalihalobacterium alkalinitrilicum]|uniref:glycosyltransferase family 2 protein n=1 Tax=Alkalihalobacterium alkalinitrilicum TaxID=427920 RepID=UPI000994B817|nr:glycosyltransferase [Alkalihalobacterium alkalinitrilicum]
MSIKVSVIIPVYNAEKYLAQCIESLLSQALQDCEFIFINDGSKDDSCKIIEDYKEKDPRIILINQENRGVSIARNNGLQIASGEYIGFVDADDYIEMDMYATLYHSAKLSDCDVVISNFENEIDGHKVMTKYPFPLNINLNNDYINQEILPYFIKSDNLNTACNKLYKNKIIIENSIKFPEKLSLGEDGMFNMIFFSQATTTKYIDYTGYHYREVEGSATRNISKKDYFERALEVYQFELPEQIVGHLDKEKIHQFKAVRLIKSVLSYIHVYFSPSNEVSFKTRYEYIKNMISNQIVREALPTYCELHQNTLGKYEKFLLNMVKKKSTMGLYCVTAYSRLRNR